MVNRFRVKGMWEWIISDVDYVCMDDFVKI